MKTLFSLIRWVYLSKPFLGKERIKTLLLMVYRTIKYQSKNLVCKAYDGRKFRINLYDRTYDSLYFTGYFEKYESHFIEKIIGRGDIILDIGANFGWYTTLCAKLCLNKGELHAFEPIPSTLKELYFNLKLNHLDNNVVVNAFALGDEIKKTQIYLFKGLPHSHASLSKLGRNDGQPFLIDVLTLDDYANTNLKNKQVRFIKLDVEGAELNVLNGSNAFMSQQKDIWMLFEINLETSKAFGYDPQKLFEKLEKLGFKNFYVVNHKGVSIEIDNLNTLEHGTNVFCHKKE